jgi:hypothetical protein
MRACSVWPTKIKKKGVVVEKIILFHIYLSTLYRSGGYSLECASLQTPDRRHLVPGYGWAQASVTCTMVTP